MKIIAVSNVKNEADIIEAVIANLIHHGIDSIITTDGMSTDGTRDILTRLGGIIPIRVINDPCEHHHQKSLMNMVANLAAADGADWILPFDADEFWYAEDHETIRDALASTDAQIVNAGCYQYFDYTMRETARKPFAKVVFRPTCRFDLAMGSHSVWMETPLGEPLHGLLGVREVQFRGFDHFCWKVRQRAAAFPPEVEATSGAHVRKWAAMSDDELAIEWGRMEARAPVSDPVPILTHDIPEWSAP